MCHVNMLKAYHFRGSAQGEEQNTLVSVVSDAIPSYFVCMRTVSDGLAVLADGQQCGRLSNSEFLSSVDSHLSHLPEGQRDDGLFHSYSTR